MPLGERTVEKMKRFFSFLFWKEIKNTGVYSYQENEITFKRKIIRTNSGGHQPIDLDWLNGH